MAIRARPWNKSRFMAIGLLSGIGLAVLLALGWMLLTPSGDRRSIEDTIQTCADLFDAGHWSSLSHYAWPPEEREAVAQRLDGLVPQGFKIRRPVSVTLKSLEGDHAVVSVWVKWSMAMGRVTGEGRRDLHLIQVDGEWYLDAKATEGLHR